MYRRYTPQEFDDLVARCRKEWGIENDLRPNFLSVVQNKFPKLYPGFKLRIVPDGEMGRNSGIANSESLEISIKKSVADGVERDEPEAIYIFLEEVAHLVMGHDGVRFRRTNDVRARAVGKVRGQEAEAKEFSLRVMSPTSLAEGCNTIEQLIEKFSLNRPLAKRRLRAIEKERQWSNGEDLKLPNVFNFQKEAASRGKQIVRSGAGYQHKFSFAAPSEGLLAVLDIDLGSPNALCTVFAHIPGKKGGVVPFDIEGPRARFRLKSAPNEIYIEPRTGVQNLIVAVVDWYDPDKKKNSPEDSRTLTARLLGYTDQPCPECCNKTIKYDGNRKTCDGCGWSDAVS
jgi:hypothetical protein